MAESPNTQRRLSRLENDISAIYELLAEVLRRLDAHDERHGSVEASLSTADQRLRAVIESLRDGSDQKAA